MRDPPPPVVLVLQPPVRVTAVDPSEFVLGEKALRVERLDAAEFLHLLFDHAVEMPARVRRARALHIPEPEIDIPVRLHRVQREAPGARRSAAPADPLAPEAHLARLEMEELAGARKRDVDVLDH